MSNFNPRPPKPDPTASQAPQKEARSGLDQSSIFENNPIKRMEFAHENITLSPEHVLVCRVGYLGGGRDRFVKRMNKVFGEGNWTLGYMSEGRALDRDQALELYQKSYEAFFKNNPEYTQRMLREARDVYDTNVSNVSSGLNWHAQEDSRSHLQDIAVRRALNELGLAFQGDKLLQIRGRDSDLPELNPGRVPFISPQVILRNREFDADWVQIGSVEDFWQNNKFLFVKTTKDVVDALHKQLDAILTEAEARGWKIPKDENWKDAGQMLRVLLIEGEADSKLVDRFRSYVAYVESIKPDDFSMEFWIKHFASDLSYNPRCELLSDQDIMSMSESLIPLFSGTDHEFAVMAIGHFKDKRIYLCLLCALASYVAASDPLLHPVLREQKSESIILGTLLASFSKYVEKATKNPAIQEHLRKSPLSRMSPQEIKEKVIPRWGVSERDREAFIDLVTKAGKS